MRLWLRWMTWLCLSLMLWTVGVESTHNHATPSSDASCTICAAAHTARPMASSPAHAPVFAAVGVLYDEEITARAQFHRFDAGIRGPPVL